MLVDAPIRVSESSHARIVKASQNRLIQILRTVPIYAYLLDEYPQASVCVRIHKSEEGR